VLVHGTTGDHTTFRVLGPILAGRFTVHSIDRRGRGASGDRLPYSIVREFEDVAAVVDAIAAESGGPVDVFGHSFGGRCGLGAALLTPNLRRLVVYEGAPPPPGMPFERSDLVSRLETLLAAGRRRELVLTFLAEVVGLGPDELAAFEASPVWEARLAAADTIPRELAAAAEAPEAGLDALGRVAIPVLLVVGGDSRPVFRAGTDALAARLPDARVVVIPGQRHAAHHDAADRLAEEVVRFLGR